MLNYWRTTAGGNGGGAATLFTGNSTLTSRPAASPFSDYGFDGPFFDLEFTLSNANVVASETPQNSGDSSESDEDMREIELNLDGDDRNFKRPSSIISNNPEESSKFPVSLLKSAAKFGVLFKKTEKIEAGNRDNKLLGVKLKVDEDKGPLISLFARDYSISEDSATNSEHLGKEVLQKYLNILKPLYVRVEKMKLSGQFRFQGGGPDCGDAASPPPEISRAGLRSNNLQAGFKVVRKHLGKSRSTSAAASAVSPPGKMGSNRRDDSLLELQDGIQGAILHCKRSFNSNRERELSRTVSDAYCAKSVISTASYPGEVVETVV